MTKKIVSVVLALALILSMSVIAFAAPEAAKTISANAIITRIVIAVVGGLLIALIVCSSMKAAMKTTGEKREANDYMSGNLNLTVREDKLVDKLVSKRKIESDQS